MPEPGMPQDFAPPSWGEFTDTNTTLVTSAETVGISVRAFIPPKTVRVIVLAQATVQTNTGATTVLVRVRKGFDTLSGGVLNLDPAQIPVTAGDTVTVTFLSVDPIPAGSQAYTCTVAQSGASANGTILNCSIIVIPIGPT